MKYLCAGCERLVEPAAVRVDGAEVVLRCPKCGAEERAALSGGGPYRDRAGAERPAAASPLDPRPGGPACPKCGAPRDGGEACPRCGLIYARWRDDALPAPPEAAAAVWERLETSWDDAALHERFLTACLEAGDLAYAARCYRGHDDPKAREQLDKLTVLGVQAMRGAEQPSRVDPRLFRYTGWFLFIAISIALLVLAFMARG